LTARRKTKKNIDLNSLSSNEKQEFLKFLKLKTKFQPIYNQLEKAGVPTKSLIDSLESDISIPISIFNEKLSALETIVKYLKENLNLDNKKISSLINKSSKSIWQAYNNSKQKHPKKLEVKETKYSIPISILKERKSILESIVLYLKDSLNLSYHQIALLLKRDDRTIWTVYQRARKKHE